MLCLKWTFVILSTLHMVISIKASVTGTEGPSDVVSLPLDDPMKAGELDKKLEDSITEKDQKSFLNEEAQIEDEIHAYITFDPKHPDTRIQEVIESLDNIKRILSTCDMADLAPGREEEEKGYSEHASTVFSALLKTPSLPLIRLVKTIIRELDDAIDRVKKGDTQAYETTRNQFLKYCKILQFELKEQLRRVPVDTLTGSEIKLMMSTLIDKGILETPKTIAEKLYGFMLIQSKYENVFAKQSESFEAMERSMTQFQEKILDVGLWGKSIEEYKDILEEYWKENQIGLPFGFILDILTDSFSRMLGLDIPIVVCATCLLAYLKQVEHMYWCLYASRIHAFELLYAKADDIASAAVEFVQSHSEKGIAKSVVNEFVTRKPESIVDMAFEHSQEGIVSKKTLELLENNMKILYAFLNKKYDKETRANTLITMIYDEFLFPLIKDLSYLQNRGIVVHSNPLLKAIKSMLQNIKVIFFSDGLIKKI